MDTHALYCPHHNLFIKHFFASVYFLRILVAGRSKNEQPNLTGPGSACIGSTYLVVLPRTGAKDTGAAEGS